MPNLYKNWEEKQRKHWNDYNKKYAKEHFKSYNLKLRLEEDKDIIEYLETNKRKHKSLSDLIRGLVREKIASK